ncbi:MAG TPA: phosphatase PAP2 family protein [Allosphingosinicella sp.]
MTVLQGAAVKPSGDREWLAPCIGLTLISGILGIALIPSYAGILPAIGILPWWMLTAVVLGGLYGLIVLVAARVSSPLGHLRKLIIRERRAATLLTFGIFLAGLNMTTFMWMKPLLNYLIPFWADPALADIDKALFLGRDPWTLLTWLNSGPTAIFYHSGWFALMMLTLLAVLTAPPSPEKSALMTTYFLLWSAVGPLVHALVPAAGPVFYAQLGYGDRFSALQSATETKEVATYLWTIYAGEGFGPGSGISAMPSLHIATTAWMIIAVRALAWRWTVPIAAAGVLIFLLSISLGWHYAVDGIVGGGCAWLCYRALRFSYGGNRTRSGRFQPAVA